MSKFKVGDRVRTAYRNENNMNSNTEDGIEFVVTGVDSTAPYGTYYSGDPNGWGIWEKRLVLVEAAVSSDYDPVSHPSHYQHPSGIEVIDITRHESFLRGNVIKYVLRAPYKGTELQDLQKARQYLDWEISRVEAEGD